VNYTYFDQSGSAPYEINKDNPNNDFILFLRDPNSTFIVPIQYGLTPTILQLTCFLEAYTWNADFTNYIALGALYYDYNEVSVVKQKIDAISNYYNNYLWILSQIEFYSQNYNSDTNFGTATSATNENYDLGTICTSTNEIYRWSFVIQIKQIYNENLYYMSCIDINSNSFVYYNFGPLTSCIEGVSVNLFVKPSFISTNIPNNGPSTIYDAYKNDLTHFVHPSGSIYCEINSERYFLCVLFCSKNYKESKSKNVDIITGPNNQNNKKLLAYINLKKMKEFIKTNQTNLLKNCSMQFGSYFIHYECIMFNLCFPLTMNIILP